MDVNSEGMEFFGLTKAVIRVIYHESTLGQTYTTSEPRQHHLAGLMASNRAGRGTFKQTSKNAIHVHSNLLAYVAVHCYMDAPIRQIEILRTSMPGV
jgi:hypothetical protein